MGRPPCAGRACVGEQQQPWIGVPFKFSTGQTSPGPLWIAVGGDPIAGVASILRGAAAIGDPDAPRATSGIAHA